MTGSFVIKKNRILEILFFIIIFLVNLKMTLNISDFATANLSILIIGISFISLLFTKIDDNIYWIVLFFILSLFRVEASKMFPAVTISEKRDLTFIPPIDSFLLKDINTLSAKEFTAFLHFTGLPL